MGQGVQFFFGISHCTQHTIAVCSVLIALWDFLMQVKSKGHLVSSGFCVGFFPYTHLRLLCNGNQRVVWFHQVSCQIFPPTTVHNMRLLCKLKSKGSFRFISSGFCVGGFFLFFVPLYIQQSRLFMQSKSNVVFLGCCVAFLHSVQKTQWQKTNCGKTEVWWEKLKSCHHVFSHQNVESWTKCQRGITKHKFLDPHYYYYYYYYYHHILLLFMLLRCNVFSHQNVESWTKCQRGITKHKFLDPHYYYYYYHHILLLFMLLRCNFQSRNPETPLP